MGDVFRCGSALFEITQPRTPCFKQARKLDVPTFVKLILQTGKLGYLARVLEEGEIGVGDAFELLERPCPQANLVFVNRVLYDNDREAARELGRAPGAVAVAVIKSTNVVVETPGGLS